MNNQWKKKEKRKTKSNYKGKGSVGKETLHILVKDVEHGLCFCA